MNEKKQEQLKKVMQEHPEINDKIKELHAKIQEEMQAKMIELLKEYGVELTEDDLKAPGGELSDDELNAVAGGKITPGCLCISGGTGMVGRHGPISSSEGFEPETIFFSRGG